MDKSGQRFRGRFRVVDADSREPLIGARIRIRSTGGLYLAGTTDSDGCTAWVERDAAERLAFDMADQQ